MTQEQLKSTYNHLEMLGDKLWELYKGGMPPSDAFMNLVNQLESQANVERQRAFAIANLAIEAMINKYEKRQHYTQEQLMGYWNAAFPNTAQNGNMPKQGNGFPRQGF